MCHGPYGIANCQHGKDTVAQILKDYSISYVISYRELEASSRFYAHVINLTSKLG